MNEVDMGFLEERSGLSWDNKGVLRLGVCNGLNCGSAMRTLRYAF